MKYGYYLKIVFELIWDDMKIVSVVIFLLWHIYTKEHTFHLILNNYILPFPKNWAQRSLKLIITNNENSKH